MHNNGTIKRKYYSDVCAIILAAGKSSRMGEFKPLLEVEGITSVERLITSCINGGVNNIVVVTGYNNKALEQEVTRIADNYNENIVTAHNKDYEQGMFTSIKTGIKKALGKSSYNAFLLFPVDVPLVPSKIISRLIETAKKSEGNFAVPCFEGKKGHPLYIPNRYIDEILNHHGTNGLKGVTSKYEDTLIRMETHNEAVVLDMDTPEDYKEILKLASMKESDKEFTNIFEETGFTGKLYLIRHGSTKQHQGKIFMGQVDIPLSEEGRKEASNCAEELLSINPNTNTIYTSPLSRALETAEIIKEKLNSAHKSMTIVESNSFMEMSLGDWDGKYIDEIKRDYPNEYKKRGENLTTYKRYPNGENNFDLKYRVIKELKKIMSKADSGEDIILVCHKGVINVIRESINGLDAKEAIKYNPPRGSVTIICQAFFPDKGLSLFSSSCPK